MSLNLKFDFEAPQYKNPLERIHELEMAVHDLKAQISILYSRIVMIESESKNNNLFQTPQINN